jgi:hypothetical protein
MSFTQPICDNCWDKENPDRRSPRHMEGEIEQCCLCGESTRSGIYIRRDPKTVPYPNSTETQ